MKWQSLRYYFVGIIAPIQKFFYSLCTNICSQPPTPTAQHSAVVAWGRFMIVSGGYDGEWFRNDIYCLDLKKALWNKVKMQGAMHKVEHHRETKFRVLMHFQVFLSLSTFFTCFLFVISNPCFLSDF